MQKAFFDLKTDEGLLVKLRTAGAPSPKEAFEQRVSFVYGSMSENSGVTRDQVRAVIREQVGEATGVAA